MSDRPLLLRWDSGATVRFFGAEMQGYAGDRLALSRRADRSADDGSASAQQVTNAFREFVGVLRVKADPDCTRVLFEEEVDEGSFAELQEAYAADDLEVCSTFDEDYWAGTFVEDLTAAPEYDPMLNYASVPVKIVQVQVESES